MKAATKLLTLVAVCVGLVMMMGAPLPSALLAGLVAAGMMLHGALGEHPRPSFEPSSFQAGARRPPHWYCADCGRTWSAPLDSGADAASSRAAAS
jgi:hypothetical protein